MPAWPARRFRLASTHFWPPSSPTPFWGQRGSCQVRLSRTLACDHERALEPGFHPPRGRKST